MSIRNSSPSQSMSARKLIPILLLIGGIISGCTKPPQTTVEPALGVATETLIPVVQVVDVTPPSASVDVTVETYSSDKLGLCFSYPQGYTQLPYNDAVEIVAPELPGSDLRGLFWLEIRGANTLTAKEAAEREIAEIAGFSVNRWTVMLGDEEAVVMDGMPGQELVRQVFVIHENMLYILTFSPTLSENSAVSEQMEALYDAVTSTWAWSACPASE